MRRFWMALIGGTSSLALAGCGGGGGGGVHSSGSLPAPSAMTPGPGVAPTPTPSPTPAPAPAPSPSPTPAPTPTPTPTPTPAYPAPVAPPSGFVVTPSTMQPVRSANDTIEYRRNYTAAELTNALYALDNGWTGKGVTVGVIDDGVNTALPAFAGQISPLSKDFGYETRGGVETKRNNLGDASSTHGTPVAAIIAGKRDGSGPMGHAPDASIAVLRVSDYDFDTKTEVLHYSAAAIDYATGAGIKLLNRSLASEAGSNSMRNAMMRYAAAGGLVVNSAGNESGAEPAEAFNVTATNRDAWLFVVAVNASTREYALTSYSNKAGSLMDRTVAAVGTHVTTESTGDVGSFSGTSAAAPQVTALAATILSKWPQLSGQDAGEIILATARDIGEPGTDVVFGRGLIDFRAALSPVDPKLSNGVRQTSLAASAMAVPEALGGAAIRTALSNVTLLDGYGRDFTGSIAGLVVQPEGGDPARMARRVAQMDAGGGGTMGYGPYRASFGFANYRFGAGEGDMRSQLMTGEVAVTAGRTTFRTGFNAQDSLQQDIMGLAPFADGTLAYAPQAGTTIGVDRSTALGRLGLTIGTGERGGGAARTATLAFDSGSTALRASWIDERGSIMGLASQGALSLGRGATTAMVEAKRRLGIAAGWQLEGYGSVGVTRIRTDAASVVTDTTPLIGTRIGVQASGPMLGGLVSLGIAQPLTIESGTARLTLGSGYDLAHRSLIYSATDVALAGDRRLQLTAGFARGGEGSSFRAGLMHDVVTRSVQALAGYRLGL